MSAEIRYDVIAGTPLGAIGVAVSARGVVACTMQADAPAAERELRATFGARLVRDARATATARRQVREFLARRRRSFELPLDLSGARPFERAVWRATAAIPWGEVRSYGEIAAAVGRPGAARAVGGAMGRNPVCLVVPCHRVVAAGRRLGGFGGGEDRKRWLLALEGVRLAGESPPGARRDAI